MPYTWAGNEAAVEGDETHGSFPSATGIITCVT